MASPSEEALLSQLSAGGVAARFAALDEIAKRDELSERILDAVVARLDDRAWETGWGANTYDDSAFCEDRMIMTVAGDVLRAQGARAVGALLRALSASDVDRVLSVLYTTISLHGRELSEERCRECTRALQALAPSATRDRSLRLLTWEARRRAGTVGDAEHLAEIESLLLSDSPKSGSSRYRDVWRGLEELPADDARRIAQAVFDHNRSEIAAYHLKRLERDASS